MREAVARIAPGLRLDKLGLRQAARDHPQRDPRARRQRRCLLHSGYRGSHDEPMVSASCRCLSAKRLRECAERLRELRNGSARLLWSRAECGSPALDRHRDLVKDSS